MKKIAKVTYDNWAKEFSESFWANTMGWGMAFCNQFNIEDNDLWAHDDRIVSEITIFEKYVDEGLAPEVETATEFNWEPYPNIPADIRTAITDYVNKGTEPNGLIVAALSNDLISTVGSARSEEMPMIKELVEFIYNDMPFETWGSTKAYRSYRSRFEVPEPQTAKDNSVQA